MPVVQSSAQALSNAVSYGATDAQRPPGQRFKFNFLLRLGEVRDGTPADIGEPLADCGGMDKLAGREKGRLISGTNFGPLLGGQHKESQAPHITTDSLV